MLGTLQKFSKIKYAYTCQTKTKGRSESKHIPWWNAKCEAVIKNDSKALYKLKKHNTIENLIEQQKFQSNS